MLYCRACKKNPICWTQLY